MKRIKEARHIILGMLLTAMFINLITPVLASATFKQLNAYFNNIKIVVNGTLLNSNIRDLHGNPIEPFVVDGRTYLPVAVIAEAFGVSAEWDGATSTVFLGGKVDKPAIALPMYSRSYIEVSHPGDFRSYTDKGIDYVGFSNNGRGFVERADKSGYDYNAYVVYPLNGVATKLIGKILAPEYNGSGTGLTTVYTFRDEMGKILYQSPIMIDSTNSIDFEIDVSRCLSIKIELSMRATNLWGTNNGATSLIQNMQLTTTDYQ
ncbi:MAG: copper amine oxidase N-terminal domain-containing protein [Oscillospiraceae bacterium]|nr:copper amine oxidase N-terminal domain-containing protein [Oscillospiraceae bacterium]